MTDDIQSDHQPTSVAVDGLSAQEQRELLAAIPEWSVRTIDSVPRLMRTFAFGNFQEALDFVNQVGESAEAVNHHPLIHFTWGTVTIEWWTHSIGGLHKNDLQMAVQTDAIFDSR